MGGLGTEEIATLKGELEQIYIPIWVDWVLVLLHIDNLLLLSFTFQYGWIGYAMATCRQKGISLIYIPIWVDWVPKEVAI